MRHVYSRNKIRIYMVSQKRNQTYVYNYKKIYIFVWHEVRLLSKAWDIINIVVD